MDPTPPLSAAPEVPGVLLPSSHGRAAWAFAGATGLLVAVALALGSTEPITPQLDAVAKAVTPGRAYDFLAQLQAGMPSRTPGSKAHRDAQTFIADAMRSAGVQDVHFERPERLGLCNILGRILGVDRTREVVLAAHYDVFGIVPGAIDDGGAIAAILEAARVLTARPEPPACDVVVAIFDLEEPPHECEGSEFHLDRKDDAGRARIRAAMAVELVGWKGDALVVHTLPYGFAWDAEGIAPAWVPAAVRGAADAAGLTVGLGDPYVSPWYQGAVRTQKIETGSDAGRYSERGIPACMLTGSALTNFYPGYHTPSDTMKRVSSERLDDAARAIACAGLELAAVVTREQEPPRRLGDVYLVLGLRHLGRGVLALLLALTAAALLVAGLGWRSVGQNQASALLVGCALVLVALAGLGSVSAVVVGVPLGLALAVSGTLRRRWLLLFSASLPLYVEVLLVVAASAMFGGFAWRGHPLELVLLILGGAAGVRARLVLQRIGTVESEDPPEPVESEDPPETPEETT